MLASFRLILFDLLDLLLSQHILIISIKLDVFYHNVQLELIQNTIAIDIVFVEVMIQ